MTQTENIAAALLLKKMGVDPADLLQDPAAAPEIPTFAGYIPRVSRGVSPGTRRLYTSYWNQVVYAWGQRLITEPSPLEIGQLAEEIKANVVHRRNARGGRSAAEHLIGALRCMYNHAVADGFLPEAENPAARVPKPRRPPASRTALPDGRLAEISAVAASTSDDPALDALIIRLHAETACRRGGALALTPEDLDPEHCLIRLREKGGTERWQPVSPTLMTHLRAHAESRGGLDSGERLLRYATGKPITARRYDYLWTRLGEHLPWVKTQQVSTHWIRHAKAPAAYLADAAIFPTGASDDLLRPHFIDASARDLMEQAPETLTSDEAADIYERFLQAREAVMIEEIRKACGITSAAGEDPAGLDEPAADIEADEALFGDPDSGDTEAPAA